MPRSFNNSVPDAALAEIATATTLVLCSAAPVDFAGVAAVALADVELTPGTGGGDFAIADGDTSGRKLTVAAQTGFLVDTDGTATHVALHDGVDLLFVTECTNQVLTTGNTVDTAAFDIEIADPTA